MAAAYSSAMLSRLPGWVPDIDQLWVAANALRTNQDPYAFVAAHFPFPLYYPGPAIIVALPLSLMPLPVARTMFAGVGAALLTFAVTGRGWWMLWLLMSDTLREALLSVQWSPYLTAAALLPWLGAMLPAKPTIGVAVGASYPSRRLVVSASLMLAISLVVIPGWVPSWWSAIHHGAAHIRAPITRPFGWLLLLALLRWRRPEARLLACLACVPQTSVLYETLPLFLIAQTRIEVVVLAILSYVPNAFDSDQFPSLADRLTALWPWLLVCAYLPALAMVLLRPNSAPQPE